MAASIPTTAELLRCVPEAMDNLTEAVLHPGDTLGTVFVPKKKPPISGWLDRPY